jgi:hypothetical protein
MDGFVFNPPPGWPTPPAGWVPPEGWRPDPTWPPAPPGWSFWIQAPAAPVGTVSASPSPAPAPSPASPRSLTPTAPPAASQLATPPVTAPPLTPSPAPAPSPPPVVAETPSEVSTTEVETLRRRVATLEEELERARRQPSDADVVELDDERVLQEVGIYHYHHPLENSEEYRSYLQILQVRIKEFVVRGDAIMASDMFTFNNSLAKGRRMTADLSKLMLRAYNAEADNCVRALRSGNVVTAKKRLEAAVTSIAKLGSMMEIRVNPAYHDLRVEELELTADFQMRVQEERERAREERERLREERRAEQELAAERERLDKERAHLANALEALQARGDEVGVAELSSKLEVLDDAIAQNDFRTANIRAGYVYVISNPGAFGQNMIKIGMTRRLEPMDRVRELGDASVPFPFDVHALFFSEDAVTLENELHKAFAEVRVNRVNERREFFFATPQQVHSVLAEKVGNLLEFTERPEATQYLQSQKYWPTGVQ